MVGKTDFIALACGIDDEIVVQIEQKTAHVFIVDFTAAIGLLLCNDFTTVFRYEFVFLCTVLQEDAPAGHIRRCHQQMLMQTALNTNIFACDLCQIELIRATRLTEIWITFAHSQIAWTLLCVTLCLAPTTWKPILAIAAAITEFLAKVLRLNARTRIITGPLMITR